jgi:hypothetical protein
MLNTGETASSPPNKSRAPLLALISLLLFVGGAAVGVRGFLVRDGVQWRPQASHPTAGPVRTRFMTYEAALARGVIAFYVVRDEWTKADAGRQPGWNYFTFLPSSLITEPLPQDRTNFRLAGFQWYHGVFQNQVPGLQAHVVHVLVLPLWPLLLVTAIPPWLWWRRRRIRGPGFPVIVRG